MVLLSELKSASPMALVKENLERLLALLKKYIQVQGFLDQDTCMQIVPEICLHLQVQTSEWDWLSGSEFSLVKTLQLEIAVSCFNYGLDDELLLQLIHSISLYINKYVPWSNPELARICNALNRQKCVAQLAKFADSIKPRFLSISGQKFTTILARRNGKLQFTKTRVARQALGLQIPSATEDNERTKWKMSRDVMALSSAVLLMEYDDSSQHAAMCVPFILNVLDDPEPLFRAQGCFLFQYLVESGHGKSVISTGLTPVFEKSVKTCLTYLPQLTPPEVSLRLLEEGAFPALFHIMELYENTTYFKYLEILDGHLLALISHVLGRKTDAVTNKLLAVFLKQSALLIVKVLRFLVFACFSRLNYILCKIISDPYIIESENGNAVVENALVIQNTLLTICQVEEDIQATRLLLQYKYDFLASWAILVKRIVKYGAGPVALKDTVLMNLTLLQDLAEDICSDELAVDLYEIRTNVPELQDTF